MIIEKSKVNRILVITLSNVGDIILTTPVINALKKEIPHARIDVMVGPNGRELFEKDPKIFKLIIYDKHLPISAKRRLQLKLKNLRYDLVIDLRNTVFPLLIGPKYRTSPMHRYPQHIAHSIDKHLHRLTTLGIGTSQRKPSVHITDDDDGYVSKLIIQEQIAEDFVVINAGAKSHLKRWTVDGFAKVADALIEKCRVTTAFIGLEEDVRTVDEIMKKMTKDGRNLVGKMNIRQLASLLKKSKLLITNDSAPLHLGCAVDAKVLALFGPTNPKKYGPTGDLDLVIHKKLHCVPCESATCKYNYECMTTIDPDEVFDTARMMIEGYGE